MAFDYSGGVGASLARALTAAGQGYEEGINERLQRQAEQAQIQNANAAPIIDFLNAHPGASLQQAYDYVSGARSGSVPVALPPPVQNAPAAPPPAQSGNLGTPVAPKNMGSGDLGVPLRPAMNGSGNLGTPPPNPVTQAFAPLVPPPAAKPMPPALAQALAPIVPNPPMPGVPQPTAVVPPVAPTSAPASPQVAPPPVPAPVNAGVPPMPPATPPVVPLPWTQRPLRDVVGPSQQELIWGVRTQAANDRNKLLADKYGNDAMKNFTASLAQYSTNPEAQMRLAQMWDQRTGTTDFTNYLQGGTGLSDKAANDQAKEAISQQRADAYTNLTNARIPDILAAAGLKTAQGKFYDARTGEVVPLADAQIKLEGSRSALLGVQADELPKMDLAKMALEKAEGNADTSRAASAAENADTGRINAGTRAALTTAQIQHLASENGVDAARIEEISQKDPAFVQNSIALRAAQDRLQKARSIQDTTQRKYALNLAYQDINRLEPLVYQRLRGNGAPAPPAPAPATPVPQVPAVPMPGQRPAPAPRQAAPTYTPSALKTINGVTKPVSEWRQIYQQQTGKPAPF